MNCHWKLRRHIQPEGLWQTWGSGRHADMGFICVRCGKKVVMMTTRHAVDDPGYAESRRRDEDADWDARSAAWEDHVNQMKIINENRKAFEEEIYSDHENIFLRNRYGPITGQWYGPDPEPKEVE